LNKSLTHLTFRAGFKGGGRGPGPQAPTNKEPPPNPSYFENLYSPTMVDRYKRKTK